MLAALAAALGVPEPAPAQVLAGETTLVGSSSGVVRVSLPEASPLSFDPLADVVGSGPFVGYVLTLDPLPVDSFPPNPPAPQGGSVLIAGRVDDRFRFANSFGTPMLEAGTYRLYLLTESAARVTLHFTALEGAMDLPAPGASPFTSELLDPVINTEPAGSIYSAGEDGTLEGPGLGLVFLWVRGPNIEGQTVGNSGAFGSCLYNLQAGDPPPDPSVAYLPGCPWLPQSESLVVFQAVQSPGAGGFDFAALAYLHAGGWGLGAWFSTASVVEDGGAVAAWITLADPHLDPVPATATSWGRLKGTYARGRQGHGRGPLSRSP